MNDKENFNQDILIKYLNKEVNSGEKSEVENWLKQSEKNREELEQIRQMLSKVDDYYKVKSFDSAVAWHNIHSKITAPRLNYLEHKQFRKEALIRFYKYAAIIIVAIMLGSVGFYIGFRNQNKAFYSEIVSSEKQVVNEYVLPDGSKVTLNNNSELRFPKHFKNDVREVIVHGEAFFDVKRDTSSPFIIHAGNAQVKVLGTSFNVCAYPNTETVEVVVKTGKVEVTNVNQQITANKNREVILAPGEKGTLFNSSDILEKTTNSDPNFMAWKTRDLVFNKVPLKEVFKSLEKVYHVEIQVINPEINDLLLNAQFDHKPVEFVLNVIQITFNLDLAGENKQFTISERKKEQAKL